MNLSRSLRKLFGEATACGGVPAALEMDDVTQAVSANKIC